MHKNIGRLREDEFVLTINGKRAEDLILSRKCLMITLQRHHKNISTIVCKPLVTVR